MIRCLTFRNPARCAEMKLRFERLSMPFQMVESEPHADRATSIMKGHLKMIRDFLSSDEPYGVFAEDDIVIRKSLPILLPKIKEEATKRRWDIVLLGHLWSVGQSPSNWESCWENGHCSYGVAPFGDDSWGTQMYMLSRPYAQWLVDQVSEATHSPFAADFTITKCSPKRVMVWPLLAVENGDQTYDNVSQQRFHSEVYRQNFIASEFV